MMMKSCIMLHSECDYSLVEIIHVTCNKIVIE